MIAEFAVGERAAVVGADVVDRVVAAFDVEQGDHLAVDLDERLARVGNLGDVGDAEEVCHGGHDTLRMRLPIARASASRTGAIVMRSKTC